MPCSLHQSYSTKLMNSLPESGSRPSISNGKRSRIDTILCLVRVCPLLIWAYVSFQNVRISTKLTLYAISPDNVCPQCTTVSISPYPGLGLSHISRRIGMSSFRLLGLVVDLPPPIIAF